MRKQIISLAMVGLSLLAASAMGQALPAEEKAFFDKHMTDFMTVVPKRLSAAAVTKAFAVPVYEVTVTMKDGDGGEGTQTQIVARIDDKLSPISRPGSDADCPGILKMVNPDFKLLADEDAKTLQTALDALYPDFMSDDKKVIAFRHTGNEWTFVRGTFFDKKLGFVFTTDDKGKVISVKFSLKLP